MMEIKCSLLLHQNLMTISASYVQNLEFGNYHDHSICAVNIGSASSGYLIWPTYHYVAPPTFSGHAIFCSTSFEHDEHFEHEHDKCWQNTSGVSSSWQSPQICFYCLFMLLQMTLRVWQRSGSSGIISWQRLIEELQEGHVSAVHRRKLRSIAFLQW